MIDRKNPAIAKALGIVAAAGPTMPEDPLHIPLPCDVFIGQVKFAGGVPLRRLVQAAQVMRKIIENHEIRHPAVQTTSPSLLMKALMETGHAAYLAGGECNPPGHLDAEEQRAWAAGWITGLQAVWKLP